MDLELADLNTRWAWANAAASGSSASERFAQMKAWAEGAAFNENGMPRLWLHGTNIYEPFNIFTKWDEFSIGFHFGGPEAANARVENIYGEILGEELEGVIIPVVCRAANPLRIPDLYTWKQSSIASALYDAGVISDVEADYLEESSSCEMVFAMLEEAGYDSLIYENMCEHKAKPTDSLLIWRAELLKSPYAASFDKADPRLLPQLPTPQDDIENWRRLAASIASEKAAFREFRLQNEAAAPVPA